MRKKILLVDDSATVLLTERMLLDETQYDLVTARDGLEAVERSSAERPDLILMDVVMPRMNGFEAVRAIRSREEGRAVPIIMVTTKGQPVDVENGFASGCSDYVTKPIDGLELVAKVRSLLREGSAP